MTHQNRKIRRFTLVEIIAAMAVFAVLMTFLMRFFVDAQKLWTGLGNRTEVYENARLTMDLISRDLQSVFYHNDDHDFGGGTAYASPNKFARRVPFWVMPAADEDVKIRFLSNTPIPQGPGEAPFDISYKFDSATGVLYRKADSALRYIDNWVSSAAEELKKSLIWDTADLGGGVLNPSRSVYDDDSPYTGIPALPLASTLPVDNSSASSVHAHYATENPQILGYPDGFVTPGQGFVEIANGITSFEVFCFRASGAGMNLIDGDFETVDGHNIVTSIELPYAVMIRVSFLDRASWTRWWSLGGRPDDVGKPAEAALAKPVRTENERTFTKLIMIGDRGQY